MNINKYVSIILFFAITFIACDRDNNNPGYSYFPDMEDSRAYETYSENPNFANHRTLQEPVKGTVPRGYIPYPFEKNEADMKKAGEIFKNPFEYTEENLARGKVIFERFCKQCHGELGDGKGYLYTSGKYPFPPASLIREQAIAKPDGEFFHNITLGFGIMGAHGTLVLPDDRWKVILYIRRDLQKVK